MKIRNKIINVLMITIILFNMLGISNASVIDTSSKIYMIWYGDITYSFFDEEKIAVTRAYNDIPVYTTKKSNEIEDFYPQEVEVYENEKIKNIIKNGYGCKTIEELNCLNMVEAALATQEAIYIELGGRSLHDYVAHDAQAERILKATEQILEDAKKENDMIEIVEKDEYWQEYEQDTNYKYKEFFVKAHNANTGKIEILNGQDAKIIDDLGNEKTELLNEDTFYLLVPKNLGQEINMKITYEKDELTVYSCKKEGEEDNRYLVATQGTKQIYQDLMVSVIGDSEIQICNIDKETKQPIQGNTYMIIKEDGSIVKESLNTNEEGKVDFRLDKGKYYLKQESTIEDYVLNKALIEINIENTEPVKINIESTKTTTEEITNVDKEINVIAENKNIVENNITEVSNITTTNINKEIINQRNETNLNNVNNFINTINRKNVVNLKKENTYTNVIEEEFIKNQLIEGEKQTVAMTRTDYINYIDMIMLENAKVPILPVASK